MPTVADLDLFIITNGREDPFNLSLEQIYLTVWGGLFPHGYISFSFSSRCWKYRCNWNYCDTFKCRYFRDGEIWGGGVSCVYVGRACNGKDSCTAHRTARPWGFRPSLCKTDVFGIPACARKFSLGLDIAGKFPESFTLSRVGNVGVTLGGAVFCCRTEVGSRTRHGSLDVNGHGDQTFGKRVTFSEDALE